MECLRKFNLLEEEVMEQIQLMDKNKDGIITFNEFEEFFTQIFELN